MQFDDLYFILVIVNRKTEGEAEEEVAGNCNGKQLGHFINYKFSMQGQKQSQKLYFSIILRKNYLYIAIHIKLLY